MTQLISRIEFIRGDFKGADKVIRPPWALDENQFTEVCSSCGNCIESCPTSILVAGRSKFPVVDFNKGECEFCGECVNSCPTQALTYTQDQTKLPWTIKVDIKESCLALKQVVCQVCAEFCNSRAIKLDFHSSRVPVPQLDLDNCNGCGACISGCPANSIVAVSIA